MILRLSTMLLTLGTLFGSVSAASAQVSIRVPFVRVETGGGGTYVRAPFVRVWAPRTYYYYEEPVYVVPPATETLPPPAKVVDNPDLAPPRQLPAGKAMTLQDFSKTFRPRAGSYDVTLINPATNQPTQVRFTLPAGNPKIEVNGNQLEFSYGPRHFVHINFDKDGALVTSR